MGFKKVVKKGFFSGFNAKRWVGMDQIKRSGGTVKDLYADLYKKKGDEVPRKETFEECVQRYGLSEKDIQKKMKIFQLLAVGFFIGSFFVFAYTVFLFSTGMFLAGMVSLMLTFLLWAYAFREHFNYYQMKQRRLGCTVQEWFSSIVKGNKS